MQTIFPANHKENYTVINNSVLQNERLSFEARGMLCLLLSKPPDWRITISWIEKQSSSAKRKKIMRMIEELISNGYMQTITKRDKNGRIVWVRYKVFEMPIKQKD